MLSFFNHTKQITKNHSINNRTERNTYHKLHQLLSLQNYHTCTNDYKTILHVSDNNHINQCKSKHHFLKWRDNLPSFLAKSYFRLRLVTRKRFNSPKVWGVILKFATVNVEFTRKQKICEPMFLRETK